MPSLFSLSAFERFGVDLPVNGWGWFMLLILVLTVGGMISISERDFRQLRRSQIVFFIGSLFIAFVLAGIQLNISHGPLSPIPLSGTTETGATLFPFGFTLPLLIGYILGPLPALLVGVAEGIGRSLWGTHQVYDPFIYGAAAWIAAHALNQRYREAVFRYLRMPLLVSVLTLTLFGVPLLFLTTFGTVPLFPFISALDAALMASRGYLLTTLVEGLISGTIATLLTYRFAPLSELEARPATLSPFSRSYALLLMNQFLLYSALILFLVTITVSATAYNSARNLLINQMDQDGRVVSERIEALRTLSLGILVDGGRDERLLGTPEEQLQQLESIFRSGPTYRRLILVSQNGEGEFEVVAHYPPDADIGTIMLSPPENIILAKTASTSQPTISSGGIIESGDSGSDIEAIMGMSTLVAQDQASSLYLLGRIAPSSLNTLTRDLASIQASDNRGSVYILDETNQIIAHPNPSRLLTAEPIAEAALFAPLNVDNSDQTGLSGNFYHQLDNLTNRRKLEYRLTSPLHPWTTVIEVPVDIILRRALRTASPIALIILPATLLFAIYLAWRGATLSRRLNQLVVGAENMVAGNYNFPIHLDEQEDDLGQLSLAFTKMQKTMQQRVNESELLLQVSQVAAGSLTNFDRNSRQMLKWVIRGTGAAGARLIVTTRGRTPDFGEGPAAGRMRPYDRQVLPHVLQNRELYFSNPSEIRTFFNIEGNEELPFRSAIGYPLRGVQDYGALWLTFRDPKTFDEYDRSLIRSMCQQAGIMVQNDFLFTNANRGRKRFETIINNSTDPIIVTDVTRRITLFNPAVTREFQLSDDDVRLRRIDELFHTVDVSPETGQDGDGPSPFTALFSPEQTGPGTTEIQLENGKILSATISPIIQNGNRVTGHVVICRDITSFRELDELKSDFVRMASHELRSPIAAAKIALNLLPYNGDLNEKQLGKTRIIENRLVEMENLVNDLLNLGRLEANFDLDLRKTQINDLVREVIDRHQDHAAESGNELHFESKQRLPLIRVDPSFVMLAIGNLIGNAIKYASQSGPITIETWLTDDAHEIIISVNDSGPGIPTQKQPMIWDKFFRVKQKGHEKVLGSGMGLAIVKTVAERHDGRVWLESEPGHGATFFIALPNSA